MVEHNNNSDAWRDRKSRRSVVGAIGSGIIATTLFTAPVSATRERSQDRSSIKVVDGDLVHTSSSDKDAQVRIDVTSDDNNQRELSTHSVDSMEEVGSVDEFMRKGVEGVNQAKSDGYIKFEERDGEVWVVPTDKGIAEYGSSNRLSTMCGTNNYTTGSTTRGPYHAFYLDDGTSRDLASLMATGAAVSAIVALISGKSGIGAPAAIIAGIAGILAGLGATLIWEANDGCGVIIRHYPHLPEVPGVGITFRPQ